VDRVVGVFTVPVNDVFAIELLIFIEWIICTEFVGIDGERLLLANCQQEPSRRFVCGFRRHDVLLLSAAIN